MPGTLLLCLWQKLKFTDWRTVKSRLHSKWRFWQYLPCRMPQCAWTCDNCDMLKLDIRLPGLKEGEHESGWEAGCTHLMRPRQVKMCLSCITGTPDRFHVFQDSMWKVEVDPNYFLIWGLCSLFSTMYFLPFSGHIWPFLGIFGVLRGVPLHPKYTPGPRDLLTLGKKNWALEHLP